MSTAAARSLPVLFTAHGSPVNALGRSVFARSLAEWGRQWPSCRALLLVSAHWRAAQARLTGAARPETVHDFCGFPEELYALRYPAPGDPELARQVAVLLSQAGFDAAVDERRGLDHGAWAPLLMAVPDAALPVVQLSLDTRQPASFHYALAKQLLPLREAGVLVVGRGNLVHRRPVQCADRVGGHGGRI